MPLNLFDLDQDRKQLTIEFAGGTVSLVYRPNQLTPARELGILRAASADVDPDDDEAISNAEQAITRQIEGFVELVESWDVEGPLAVDAYGQRLKIPADQQTNPQGYVESMGGRLVVEPGQIVPIKAEVLRLMASNVLMTISRKINEDMAPNPKRRRS